MAAIINTLSQLGCNRVYCLMKLMITDCSVGKQGGIVIKATPLRKRRVFSSKTHTWAGVPFPFKLCRGICANTVNTVKCGVKQRRAFSVIGPSTWNELPLTLRLLPQNNVSSFCKLLKTFLLDRSWTESASE